MMNEPPPAILYHRTQAFLQKGDLIHPGSWGRMVLGVGGSHAFFFREYLFEKIRELEFSSRPGRLSSAYAFENCEFARRFRANQNLEHVYVVRPADRSCLSHRADMAWVDLVVQYRTFDGVDECARRYWRGELRDPSGQSVEWLFDGALVVEDRITPIENGFH
jgi:hypothetical protein